MTKEELLAMAQEAGIKGPLPARQGFRMFASPDRLRRFAALVAAVEREACAKVCADIAAHREVGAYGMLVAHSCANEILARGKA